MPVVTPPAAERPRLVAPLAPGWPVLGSLLDIRRDPIGTLHRASRYGDVVRLEFPRQIAFLVSDPELVKRVFVDAHEKYGKRTRGYDALRLSLGQGSSPPRGRSGGGSGASPSRRSTRSASGASTRSWSARSRTCSVGGRGCRPARSWTSPPR